jgi:DNA-binding MarR family transcriptional regulator
VSSGLISSTIEKAPPVVSAEAFDQHLCAAEAEALAPRDVEPVRQGLHRLQRLLGSRRPWTALGDAAGVDLAQQGIQVLEVLHDGEARSMAELARLARMDAAAVSRQVRDLEERGLVVRRPSTVHGRIVLIEPSDTGRATARRLHDLRDQHLVDAMASWDPGERKALGRLVLRLVDDLESTPYRRSPALAPRRAAG